MTSSSSSSSFSSAALSLVALLFVASTPLPAHAQFFSFPLPPITPLPLPAITPFPPITPLPPFGNLLLNLINVAGQLCCTATGTCPGQALAGVPATLTCMTNNVPAIAAQTVTNANGTFTLSATLSPPGLSNTFFNIFPACAVTIARSAVSGTTCSVLSSTSGVLLSVPQFGVPIVNGVLNWGFNSTVSGFVAV